MAVASRLAHFFTWGPKNFVTPTFNGTARAAVFIRAESWPTLWPRVDSRVNNWQQDCARGFASVLAVDQEREQLAQLRRSVDKVAWAPRRERRTVAVPPTHGNASHSYGFGRLNVPHFVPHVDHF